MSSGARLYFIACCFPPVGRGNAVTNSCVANALAEQFDVRVISIEDPQGILLSYQRDESLVEGLHPDLEVERVVASRWFGLNEVLYGIGLLPCYYLNWAWKVWRRRRELFAEKGVIFAVYPVFSDIALGYFLHCAYGYALIVDFRDDFSGVMARGWRRILGGYFRWMERKVIGAAAHITVTTEHLKEVLMARYGVEAGKISVVLNVVPSVDVPPRSDERQRDRFKVIYAGAISGHQRPEVLLKAYKLLQRQSPDIARRLRVQLYGPDSRYFRRHVKCHLGEGAEYGGFQPHDDVIRQVAESDIGFLCLGDRSLAYATPTKFFEYIDLEKPILGVLPAGITRNFIEEMDLGLVADIGDEETLAHHLRRLSEDPGLLARYADNIRKVKGRFSARAQLDKWIGVVDRFIRLA